MARQRRRLTREDFERGLDDYHDPTAGFGGAAPARSALTLRLLLAVFGVIFCGGGAWFAARAGLGWLAWVLLALAAVAVVDVVWIGYRKYRGEPG